MNTSEPFVRLECGLYIAFHNGETGVGDSATQAICNVLALCEKLGKL